VDEKRSIPTVLVSLITTTVKRIDSKTIDHKKNTSVWQMNGLVCNDLVEFWTGILSKPCKPHERPSVPQ
jgi:hypothetical protein